MPTPALRIQVVLNPTASTRDQVINTWHIVGQGATTPTAAATDFVTGALNTFYQAVDTYLSNELNGKVPLVRCWNYLEPKPRQPFTELNLTSLTTGGNMAPRELCVCLSYRAAYVSGVTPKRRRGRIYLGPLASSTLDTSNGMVTSAAVAAIATAADVLITASKASALWRWVVYSPTTDVNGTGEDGTYDALSGWVDDNPDIQRRRNAVFYINKPTFS